MNTNLFKIYHYLIHIINAVSLCNISGDNQAVRIVLDFTSYILQHLIMAFIYFPDDGVFLDSTDDGVFLALTDNCVYIFS